MSLAAIYSIVRNQRSASCLVQISKRFARPDPHRKPLWMPTAKTKLFRIPRRYEPPEDVRLANLLLWNNYRTLSKSIRRYFEQNFYLPVITSGGMSAEEVAREEAEQQRLLDENDQENQRRIELCEARLKEESESMQTSLMNALEIKQKEFDAKVLAARQQVIDETRRSETFITADRLEAAIEEALRNLTSYDFSIDNHGNVSTVADVLHPYAFTPSAVPETSSHATEANRYSGKSIKLKASVLT